MVVKNKDYFGKNTEIDVVFKPNTMTFKEKIVWTFKFWAGFETKIQVKVKKDW